MINIPSVPVRSVCTTLLAMLLAVVGAVAIMPARPASATTGSLTYIRCGKSSSTGTWYQHWGGGYIGDGCHEGIDYAVTPTGAMEWYDFGWNSTAGSHTFQAWVPSEYATATMDYVLQADCANGWDYDVAKKTINQLYYSGWTTLFTVDLGTYYQDCEIYIRIQSGQVTRNLLVGADAIRQY